MDPTNSLAEIEKLKTKLQSATLPTLLHDKAAEQIERIGLILKYGGSFTQLDITSKYIDWITSLPWENRTEDVLDINKTKEVLDKNHFGLTKIKSRILEYLSVLMIQRQKSHDCGSALGGYSVKFVQ